MSDIKQIYNIHFIINQLLNYLIIFNNTIKIQNPNKNPNINIIEQSLFNIVHYLISYYKDELIDNLAKQLLADLTKLTTIISQLKVKINTNQINYNYNEIYPSFNYQSNDINSNSIFFKTLYLNIHSKYNIKQDFMNVVVFINNDN